MTNYEANNSSGNAATSPAGGTSWGWLTDRLPEPGREQLDRWMVAELAELETLFGHMITQRSLKRDMRHEFASSNR